MEEKQNYVPKFKLGQVVKYVGDNKLFEFDKRIGKRKNEYAVGEVINYNDVTGYFPQSVPLKFGGGTIGDKGECHYIIGFRDHLWEVTESELEPIKKDKKILYNKKI